MLTGGLPLLNRWPLVLKSNYKVYDSDSIHEWQMFTAIEKLSADVRQLG